jgi:hypothetical protein
MLKKCTLTERVALAIDEEVAKEALLLKEQFDGLTPLAKLVLKDLSDPKEIAPVFSTTNIKKYNEALGKKSIDTAGIQAAIEALVNAKIIWRSNRGVYKLEEPERATLIAKITADYLENRYRYAPQKQHRLNKKYSRRRFAMPFALCLTNHFMAAHALGEAICKYKIIFTPSLQYSNVR